MQAATIRAIRAGLGLSAEAFGEMAGVSGRTVRRWEAGSDAPETTSVDRILAAEAAVRRMVERASAVIHEQVGSNGCALALVRYRSVAHMLPGTAPSTIELHHAVLAALRLRHGERVVIVDFAPDAYRAWLGRRADTQAARAEWAGTVAARQA